MTYKVQTVQIWNNMITEKTFKIRKTDDHREFIMKYSKQIRLLDTWWKNVDKFPSMQFGFSNYVNGKW